MKFTKGDKGAQGTSGYVGIREFATEEDKKHFQELFDIKIKHLDEKIHFSYLKFKIEKALGFNLNAMQSKFLFTNELCNWNGKESGYTTAYMIDLALNKDIEIRLSELRRGKYNDELHDVNYNHWFCYEFIKVREQLSLVGLNVVKMIRS